MATDNGAGQEPHFLYLFMAEIERDDREWATDPRDGSLYGSDMEEMFPSDIARAIFSDREDVGP